MKRTPPTPLSDVSQGRYLMVAEAGIYLRKTDKAVRRLMERQLIPYIRQERSILFDREALDAWLAGLTQISALDCLNRLYRPSNFSRLASSSRRMRR
jgi:Helix-turn-helix domain